MVNVIKFGTLIISVLFSCVSLGATQFILKIESDTIFTRFDGGKEQIRKFSYLSEPENLVTTAHEISFLSDIDSINISLNPWDSALLKIVNVKNDTAFVKIHRRAENPYDMPPPEISNVALSGRLSRSQAIFDLEALIDGISNVHPDMFSVCTQTEFWRAVNKLRHSMPDSVSIDELYLGASEIVSLLGDGHTHLLLPEDKVLRDSTFVMPLNVIVTPERVLKAGWCTDTSLPFDSEIISINAISADSIINSMLPKESGEREHFKLMRLGYDFTGLFKMMYSESKYVIKFRDGISGIEDTVTIWPQKWGDIKHRFEMVDDDSGLDSYSFTINKQGDYGIMDFKSFRNEERMKVFADSMFRQLKDNNIHNLIIDLRENGGGNSMVGDVLLRYICPKRFIQMDRILVRITPLTARLLKARNLSAEFSFIEVPESDFITPRTVEDGFFDGNVYLLISHKTFSAAASFAWLFSVCEIGTIVGEETGGMNVSYGDKVWYKLPISGLECGISFKRFWQFKADESSIHGAMPDIFVPARDALQTVITMIGAK